MENSVSEEYFEPEPASSPPISNQNKSGPRNKGGPKQMPIWDHFDTIKNGKKVVSNTCKYCKTSVSAQPQRMSNHITKCSKARLQPVMPMPSHDVLVLTPPITQEQSFHQQFIPHANPQQKITSFVKQLSKKQNDDIDLRLGRFLFSLQMSFHSVTNSYFQEFVSALNPAYKLPSEETVGTTILDKVYKEVEAEKSNTLKGSIAVLQQDGWSTNQNDAVIAHCLAVGSKNHFLSAESAGSKEKTAELCFEYLQKAKMKAEEQYNCEIVGVVTDNCNSMKALQNLVRRNLPDMEAYGCNPHLMNLLGEKFTPDDLKFSVNLVQNYFRNHQTLSAGLKDLGGLRPVLPTSTRWNSQIDAFLNYLQNQPKYLELIRKRKTTGKVEQEKLVEIKSILGNQEKYEEIEQCVNILKPICTSLDKVTIVLGTGTSLSARAQDLEIYRSKYCYVLYSSYKDLEVQLQMQFIVG